MALTSLASEVNHFINLITVLLNMQRVTLEGFDYVDALLFQKVEPHLRLPLLLAFYVVLGNRREYLAVLKKNPPLLSLPPYRTQVATQTERRVHFGPTEFIESPKETKMSRVSMGDGSEIEEVGEDGGVQVFDQPWNQDEEAVVGTADAVCQTFRIERADQGLQSQPEPVSLAEQCIQTFELLYTSFGVQYQTDTIDASVMAGPPTTVSSVQTERILKSWRSRISGFFRRIVPRRV